MDFCFLFVHDPSSGTQPASPEGEEEEEEEDLKRSSYRRLNE